MKDKLEQQIDNLFQYSRRATLQDLEEAIREFNIQYAKENLDPNTGIMKLSPKMLCIPWSAGSGKTSTIIEFIAKNWIDGIIYSTNTKEELERVKAGVSELLKDDARALRHLKSFHSDSEDWEFLKSNPQELTKHRVLFVTDSTMKSIPPSILLNQIEQFQEMAPGVDKIRKWILTDEKPTLFNKVVISKETVPTHCDVLSGLDEIGELNVVNRYFDYGQLGEMTIKNLTASISTSGKNTYLGNPRDNQMKVNLKTIMKKVLAKKYNQVTRTLEEYEIERYEVDPDHINSRKAKAQIELMNQDIQVIDKARRQIPLGDLFEYPDLVYRYDISKVLGPTHINFDGTGDITFGKSPLWKIAKNKFPYQFEGLGEFIGIPNYQSISRNRKAKVGVPTGQSRMEEVSEYIFSLVKLVKESILRGEKPLLITWLSLNSEYSTREISEMSAKETVHINDSVKEELSELGYEYGTHYFLTYWQSGKTRATNEFIEADTLIAVEPLLLPNDVISDMNESLSTSTLTAQDIFLAEFIQSIYRTRIRRGEPVKVYVSQEVADYCLQAQLYFGCSLEVLDPKLFYVYYKDHLRKNFFEDLAEATLAGKLIKLDRMEFETKQELFDIVLRARNAMEKYDSFFKAMRSVGISVYISNELVN